MRAEVLGSETIQVDWDFPSTKLGSEAFRFKLFYIKSNASEDELETQVLVCFELNIFFNKYSNIFLIMKKTNEFRW